MNHALEQGVDQWGERLTALPDGPTLRNVKPLLVPANHGGPGVAESPWSYLPLTYPAPDPARWNDQRQFSLHVADGSELLSQWSDQRASQRVKFSVGSAGKELVGAAEKRSRTPRLRDGFLPILINQYEDASGITYERESFVTRLEPAGPLVSMIRFAIEAPHGRARSRTHLRVSVQTEGIERASAHDGIVTVDGKTILAYSGDADWSSPALDYDVDLGAGAAVLYLVVANEPSAMPAVRASQSLFDASRSEVSKYWRALLASGARVDLPESYAVDAMRNTLLSNLVMGFNLTVGNGYESPEKTFAFVPEVAATVTSLGDFGYVDRFRANVEELMGRGQGGGFFLTWERGIKLQTVATYYLQTNDKTVVLEHLDTFKSWLIEFTRQREADPHGLLDKTRYASDIPDPVYGIHHQSEVWRGMRDIGIALRLIGRTEDANAFLTAAEDFRRSLLDAIEQSKTVLPDGSIFLPVGLLDREAELPYERLTNSTRGSYWNLIMPYALATGILEPNGPTARGIRDYLYKHGSLFLGLTRFNLTGGDPGICHTKHAPAWPSAPGYKSSGIDQQYGYSLARFLADSNESDRLDLSFYGMLAHSFTPNTFIAGEGATLSPCPQLGEYYRSQYWPPLSPNNATFLEALRGMLVREDLDRSGMPTGLHIAPATPRPWLRDGEHLGADSTPTSFGPIGYELTSHLAKGYVTALVSPPAPQDGRAELEKVTLHLRVPAGHRLVGARVDGHPVPFDSQAETISLGALHRPATVRAEYQATKVRTVSHAQVTTVDTHRTLVEPGENVRLGMELEMLGQDTVRGAIEVGVPTGWRASSKSVPFAAHSGGLFTWKRLPTTVIVPRNALPGDYVVSLVTKPKDGPIHTTDVHLRVAVPAAASYADLVVADQPVGYWQLNQAAADQPVLDTSGSGNTGVARGSIEASARGAIADDQNTAVRLVDGYIDIPDSTSVSLTGPYTLEAWVKDLAGGQQGVIEKYDGGGCLPSRNGYAFRLVEGNKLQATNIADQGSSGAPSERSLHQGEWHHVAAVYDGERLRTFIDGQPRGSTPVSKAPTDGSGSLKLGARGDDGGERFEGWLDEVAIYDRDLTKDEIDAHYVKGVLGDPDGQSRATTTPTRVEAPRARAAARQPAAAEASSYAEQVLADEPVGYWRLGEASGTTAQDASDTQSDGTYNGKVTLGRQGALAGDADTAVELAGGSVAVPDSESVSVTGPFTLEAWVKLDDVCQQYGIVEKYDTPALNGYALRVIPGGKLSAFTLGRDGPLGAVSGESVVTPHIWHHVVAVYDGATISVYLDGQLDGSAATGVNPTDGPASLKLGARGDDGATPLAGLLDEVAIYSHTLSPAQIEQHHSAGTTS